MSTDRSGRRGIDVGPSSTSARTKQKATPAPAAPPSIPRTRLSVSNCAISWRRLAPRAARTATSRPRACPRASSRFATFAQAMSSTSVTEPNRVTNVGRMPRTIRSCSGVANSVASFSVWGNSVARRSATVCSAVVAWPGDTVSFKRANTCTHCAPRAAGARSRGLEDERLPELCGGRKLQGGRSDADNRHVMAVERRRRVHDVRTTAESTSPEAVRRARPGCRHPERRLPRTRDRVPSRRPAV